MEIKWHDPLFELPPIKWPTKGQEKDKGWTNQMLLLKVRNEDTIQLLVGEFDRYDAQKWEWKIWVPSKENYYEWEFVIINPPEAWAYVPDEWYKDPRKEIT